MAYTFDAIGWKGFDGNEHPGSPSAVDDTYGIFVHVTNPDNPEDEHYFWAYAKDLETWGEWWVLIGSLMEMHGMELA